MDELTREQIEHLRKQLRLWAEQWFEVNTAIAHIETLCDMALRALSVPREPTESMPMVAWLIERGLEHDHIPTIWWRQNEDTPGMPYSGRWTEDANKARKFASNDLAEIEAIKHVSHLYSITEHVFIKRII